MNRARRQQPQQKGFVSGGVYDSRQNSQQYQQQQQQQPPPPPPPSVTKQQQNQQNPFEQSQQNFKNTSQYDQSENDYKNPDAPSAVTPAKNDSEMENQEGEGGIKREKGFLKNLFGIRKKPSVRAKEKKIRQNRTLRKVLLPKNALMALHEVKNIKIDDFVINSNLGGGFLATVQVNNVQYEGAGNSKNSAKNSACEKALRDLVITKMALKPSRSNSTENISASGGDDVEMKDSDDKEEDDVPMINLASFALFKLFTEWEAEGYEIPEFRPQTNQTNGNTGDNTAAADKPEKPKKPPTLRAELPPNWETMHPATLLCMMRPGLTYVDLGVEGTAPNQLQKTGVTVDTDHFIGTGKSKKISRKNAAANACNKLFNCSFEPFTN